MPCLQVFAHSVSCPRVRFFAWLRVFWACYESWRAVLSAGRKCGGGSVCYFKELLWPRRSCSLLSSLFCDVFQVAGEGHHCRSPEFCPPLESFRRSIQGQYLSDSLTFCLQKCILKVSSQFVSDSVILWEAAAGISFSKFREQTGWQLEFGVWDESVQKRIHCVCLWWASWRTFFFFFQHWDSLSRLPGRWLWANCIQHSTLIW